MAWECPECSEINEADDLIKCICGFELNGDPKDFKPKSKICPECEKRNDIEQNFCEKCGFNLKLYAGGYPSANRKRYKTFWPRFWAGFIDALVFLPISFIDPWKFSADYPTIIYVLWFLLNNTVWYFYSVLMHGKYGQTLGKMACKVKVIDKYEKQPITYRQAFLRDSVIIVLGLISTFALMPTVFRGINPYEQQTTIWLFIESFIFLFWFLLEVTTMLTNKKRRAIHDYIAGSVVVRT